MSADTKPQPRGRATYICTIGCPADCPCSVRASMVWWTSDDEASRPTPGAEYTEAAGEPCTVFRDDPEHPHEEHLAIDADGIMHRWRDGDTVCRRYQPCPSCEGADLDCPNNVLLP